MSDMTGTSLFLQHLPGQYSILHSYLKPLSQCGCTRTSQSPSHPLYMHPNSLASRSIPRKSETYLMNTRVGFSPRSRSFCASRLVKSCRAS